MTNHTQASSYILGQSDDAEQHISSSHDLSDISPETEKKLVLEILDSATLHSLWDFLLSLQVMLYSHKGVLHKSPTECTNIF